MKISLLLLALLLSIILSASAQEVKNIEEQEAAYTRTITDRARKIVNTLNITDREKADRVTRLIADQYRNLNTIHTHRNEQIKVLKASGKEKIALDASIKSKEEEATAKLVELHKTYVTNLSSELTDDQVEQVKDGMTYGVMPLTYNGYLDMLPNLQDKQKDQIRTWLIEAREYAMDAESSEKKHWWFGKYKGKINNYLSAAGYDMKKESEEWHKRLKAREADKKNVKN